jgi:hypothetical protein
MSPAVSRRQFILVPIVLQIVDALQKRDDQIRVHAADEVKSYQQRCFVTKVVSKSFQRVVKIQASAQSPGKSFVA